MEDALFLRNKLAEMGYEITPKRAAAAARHIELLRSSVRHHPEDILRLVHMSESERQSFRNRLAESGKEVTFKELDDLIEILMEIYNQEHA